MLQTAVNQNNRPTDSSSTPVINDLKPIMKGLYPAFRDSETGEVHLSLDQDGTLALDHSFFNLPQHWIGERNSTGDVMTLIPTVEAGYWRPCGFIAIAKQIHLPLDS